ncbi:hypothetical protein QYZ44_21550 [Vibrio parahaemolyticus]|nr:hypothetical protein [Vibrio parahaemolyticus]MDN4711620.1 hypothetical protein [Vibrio parahaemolyticus]
MQEANNADLYCSCSIPECGHTFVSSICYRHSLKPSKLHLGIGASLAGTRIQCGCGERAVIKRQTAYPMIVLISIANAKARRVNINLLCLYFSATR